MVILIRLDGRLQWAPTSHPWILVYLILRWAFLAFIETLGGSRLAARAGSLVIAAASMRASDRLTYRHLA